MAGSLIDAYLGKSQGWTKSGQERRWPAGCPPHLHLHLHLHLRSIIPPYPPGGMPGRGIRRRTTTDGTRFHSGTEWPTDRPPPRSSPPAPAPAVWTATSRPSAGAAIAWWAGSGRGVSPRLATARRPLR